MWEKFLLKYILTGFHVFKIDYLYIWAFWKRTFSIVQDGEKKRNKNETFLWTQQQYVIAFSIFF